MDKDVKLYNQISVRFSKMTEISFVDRMLLLKLITEATKEATDGKENTADKLFCVIRIKGNCTLTVTLYQTLHAR